jgi:ABC-type Fe3+ transport system permease subunit
MPSFEEVKEGYLNARVKQQIAHFHEKQREASKTFRVYSRLSRCASVGAVIAALAVLGLQLARNERLELVIHVFEFLGITLPLLVTGMSFLMVSQESSRRTSRYQQMEKAIKHLEPRVQAAPSWEALARAATQVEAQLFQELVEWESFVQYTEHLH